MFEALTARIILYFLDVIGQHLGILELSASQIISAKVTVERQSVILAEVCCIPPRHIMLFTYTFCVERRGRREFDRAIKSLLRNHHKTIQYF